MKHLMSYRLFEAADNDLSKMTVKAGTEMFHATGEEFDEKNLRGGGYDGVVWTTDTSAISQTYIPQSGSTLFISAEHIASPTDDPVVRDLQKSIGIEYDYDQVEWKNHRAVSYYPAPVFAEWEDDRDMTSMALKDKKIEYVKDKLKSEYGYDPDPRFSGNDLSYALKTNRNKIVPSDFRMKGRLFVITPKEDLNVFDMTYGGKLDGDLTDPDYKKVNFFDTLTEKGYDGVKINDWAQTVEEGNFGHTSIGLFPAGLKKCTWEVVPDVTYPMEFERMANERDWDSEEYKAWKKIIKVKAA